MDNITKIKDSKGRDVVEYYYDIANRLTKKMYATGAQVKYEYDDAGNIMKVIDPKDAETAYEYYGNNWLKKVIFPDGNHVSYEYSESGDLTKVTLPDGGIIEYEYFLDHSLKKVTLPDESTRIINYDLYGNIYRLTDGRGKRVRFKYDTLQQLYQTKRSLSGVDKITGYEYNKNGDLIKVTDARGNYTQFHYDKAGNIRKIQYPDNTSETFQYDGSGNLAEHTDGEGKTTHFIYDNDDRLEEVRVPNGDSVKYTYDKNGNIIKRGDHFTDESHSDTVTHYKYDSNDRLQEVKSVDSTGKVLYQHKFAYDITNLTTEFSDIFGEEYNSGKKYGSPNIIGQSQGEKYDHTYKFSEDESGIKPLKYGGGDLGFKYGELPLGEPGDIPSGDENGGDGNGEDQNGGGQSDGESSTTNIPGRIKYGMGEKKSEFTYDNLSRLTEYTDFFGNKFYYGYDRYSRLSLVRYPNEILTVYTYGKANRLDSIVHKYQNGEVIESFKYEYDANRNITKITFADCSYIEYTYDEWDRLIEEHKKEMNGQSIYKIEYSFDAESPNKCGDTGNICSKTITRSGQASETTYFEYDSGNKLVKITDPDWTTENLIYDKNDNLLYRNKSDGAHTTYSWNTDGRLTEVTLPSGEMVSYSYDGLGRLIARRDSETKQTFIQEKWDIITQIDKSGRRSYCTGMSIFNDKDQKELENMMYLHFNHRGDVVLITDCKGEVNQEINYEAYGKTIDNYGYPIEIQNSLNIMNFFLGGYGILYDKKTNLHNMRLRWYSQELLRFISPDVISGINRFNYVSGNPVILIDYFGLKESESLLNLLFGTPPSYQHLSTSEYPYSSTPHEYWNAPYEKRVYIGVYENKLFHWFWSPEAKKLIKQLRQKGYKIIIDRNPKSEKLICRYNQAGIVILVGHSNASGVFGSQSGNTFYANSFSGKIKNKPKIVMLLGCETYNASKNWGKNLKTDPSKQVLITVKGDYELRHSPKFIHRFLVNILATDTNYYDTFQEVNPAQPNMDYQYSGPKKLY